MGYMDGFYSDAGSNYVTWDTYYKGIMSNVAGGPELWNIPAASFPIKFGTNYSQSDRDGSWSNLVNALSNPQCRNFFYYGHGSPHSVGGDYTTFDPDGFPTGAEEPANSKAHMTSQDIRDKITFNNPLGASFYRFVFLDGCLTATGDLPDAWGIAKTTNDISFYSSTNNTGHLRPSAFVGWNTSPGGKDWGTVDDALAWRSAWMANWSVNNGNDDDHLNDVFNFTTDNAPGHWPPGGTSKLDSTLMIYGYRILKFNEYNRQGDWP
jgi:hypothetical protein